MLPHHTVEPGRIRPDLVQLGAEAGQSRDRGDEAGG